ncbi:hypothetical protein XH79_16290 [Bradyrhizobium sp. CCBAU 45389]|nr:hypothetical protein [Bradyrhizobium sp. CCBAU 45389]
MAAAFAACWKLELVHRTTVLPIRILQLFLVARACIQIELGIARAYREADDEEKRLWVNCMLLCVQKVVSSK